MLVLALRDEGKLALSDRLGTHLPGSKHGDITLRELRRVDKTAAIVLSNASPTSGGRGVRYLPSWLRSWGHDGPSGARSPSPCETATSRRASTASRPAGKPPAVFEKVRDDLYRTVSGREQGEWLRVERNPAGAVARMLWAGYPFTRAPQTFG